MLMSSLGQMMFSTALPTMVGELGGMERMSWVITGFLLTMTLSMPIYGKLGDQIGRKPLYLIAIALFCVASILGALATTMPQMIAARAFQGVGAGGLMVLSQSIIADVVPPRQRGKYMGIIAAVFGVSSVLGPLLGGFFTDGPGWRWALWFNVPLSVLAFLISAFAIKLPHNKVKAHLDVLGTVLLITATTCLILLLSWGGRDYGWTDPMILTLGAIAIVGAVLFVLVERRTHDPLVPLSLFRSHNFTLATIAGWLMGIMMFGSMAFLPTYLQMTFRLSPTEAGLMLVPQMAGLLITSNILGRYVTATGKYRWFPAAGMVVYAVGLVLLSTIHVNDPLWKIGVIFCIQGVGLGLFMQLLLLIVQNSFPHALVGTSTATHNFFRQIGGAMGSAIIGSFFAHRLTTDLQQSRALLETMGSGGAAEQGSNMDDAGLASGINNITPELVHNLSEPIQELFAWSYNHALIPILVALAPVALIGAVLLAFLKPEPLGNRVDN